MTVNDLQNPKIEYVCLMGDGIVHGTKGNYLGNVKNKKCRFCGKDESATAFRKIAHAFPQSIGNNPLRTNYECDECNKFFGDTIEDHFAKYFLHLNVLGFVKRQSNIPVYKSRDNSIRIEAEATENTINVQCTANVTAFVYDDATQTIKINFDVQPYIPIAVFKCFVKMALSIMPEENLIDYADTVSWLIESSHRDFYPNNRALTIKLALLTQPHKNGTIIYGL